MLYLEYFQHSSGNILRRLLYFLWDNQWFNRITKYGWKSFEKPLTKYHNRDESGKLLHDIIDFKYLWMKNSSNLHNNNYNAIKLVKMGLMRWKSELHKILNVSFWCCIRTVKEISLNMKLCRNQKLWNVYISLQKLCSITFTHNIKYIKYLYLLVMIITFTESWKHCSAHNTKY